jgi:hypothetical protein
MFIIKKQSAEEVLNKIHTHCNKNKDQKINLKFSENYLESMDSHIHSLSNKKGAFIDKETGESWSLSLMHLKLLFDILWLSPLS